VEHSIWAWIGFNVVILALLALDLGVFHRKAHAVSIKEAAIWSAVWIALSLLFNLSLFFWLGREPALQFLAGYLIEKSLSVDNIFVFVLLFNYFRVPAQYQHRVLFWGILGALVMRGAMIGIGAALISRFEWILLIFGAFLVFTGIRLAMKQSGDDEEIHPEGNILVRVVRRFLPVSREMHGERFFVRENGRLAATPLLIVLLIVESTDLLFAVDSIPAIFAVTTDPFLVYTSNVCAILGLRALYFLLAGVMDKFYYLQLGLGVILTFVGVKMLLPEVTHLLLGEYYRIPIEVSLLVIALVLTTAIVASLIRLRYVTNIPEDEQANAEKTPVESGSR
jgi:tellurite resistance protein TerC